MHEKRYLILTGPNLIIRLLHINVNFNYFQFAEFFFQQIQGTAMGAAFSPTIANIFLSVTLREFLQTQPHKPLLLKRYIDNIFIIWPHEHTLGHFLTALNSFHPNLRFTHTSSKLSVDFLDLTIHKGPEFGNSHRLDLKTFQKLQNLYQYLEYSSFHPKNIHQSIVLGECIRYVRTNTRSETYSAITRSFQKRLQERGYPNKFTGKLISRVKFSERQAYLKKANTKNQRRTPISPLFKCQPPPQFDRLKTIILQQYSNISHLVGRPRFATLAYPTLGKMLIRAEVKPTVEQSFDILIQLGTSLSNTTHTESGALPRVRNRPPLVRPCNNPKCNTCTHLNCSTFFTSSITKQRYSIRHPATCTSSNVIYLITCTKCKKQYVGLTTKQLNVRINHHRSNIFRNKTIYICVHFTFPDHNITNLSVQVIDRIYSDSLQELQRLERYWISTLKTVQPKGLNNSLGVSNFILHCPYQHKYKSK